ncbi:hypothetical protein NECAME_18827 [Necator americanus]|uniref:Uncharacterized protein n=1 Tax=Necator americanus TaxID=51031 RepID=W2SSI5_NECAM|nr:hypothetical protein NECAME_18827 [Necator americanus]ETN72473.1 hypothetical protein NECAME_18827 [Necator americanus]
MKKGETNVSNTCEFINSKYGNLCWDRINATGVVRRTLSADVGSDPRANLRINDSDILDPLNEYTRSLALKLGQIISLTGTAFDYNYDGVADTKTR